VSDPYAARDTDLGADLLYDPHPKSGRRTQLAVTWESKAIARDLAPHLEGLVYVDNLTGEADTLALEVEDRDGKWSGDWRPEFGDQVAGRLKYEEAWFGEKVTTLRLGHFAHDKISLSGPPGRVSLQCVSAVLATALRRRKRTRAWRGVTLKRIAQDIADRAELTLNFDGNEGAKYKSAAQNNKSDLEFLQELCKEVGRTVKVTEGTIAIFEEHVLDGRASSGDIDRLGGFVKSWTFDADDSGRYGSCHIKCFDPRTGKTIQYQFPPSGTVIPGLDANGQTIELAIAVSDAAEAQRRAEAILRNANKFATSGTLTTVGDPGLVAGVTFNLTNSFSLDGKYIITRSEHHAVGGYTCTLAVRRCLEGY
jgi:phage protein D